MGGVRSQGEIIDTDEPRNNSTATKDGSAVDKFKKWQATGYFYWGYIPTITEGTSERPGRRGYDPKFRRGSKSISVAPGVSAGKSRSPYFVLADHRRDDFAHCHILWRNQSRNGYTKSLTRIIKYLNLDTETEQFLRSTCQRIRDPERFWQQIWKFVCIDNRHAGFSKFDR